MPIVGLGVPEIGDVLAPPDLVRKVRRNVGDRPHRSRTVNALATAVEGAQSTIQLPAGHARLFGNGMAFEWDDGTEERCEVIDRDEELNQITAFRGMDATEPSAHKANTPILISPRFSYVHVSDVLKEIVNTELWPWVWIWRETELPYELDGHYSPTATGVEEVVSVYQSVFGERYPLDFSWVPTEQAHDADFPNGMLVVDGAADTSPLRVAYKAKPSLAVDEGTAKFTHLTPSLEGLLVLGATAHLMLTEESILVGADATATERGLPPGSRARAGAVLWERFKERRNAEHIQLEADANFGA